MPSHSFRYLFVWNGKIYECMWGQFQIAINRKRGWNREMSGDSMLQYFFGYIFHDKLTCD